MRLDDCYRHLDLDPDASLDEVKRAHRDLTKVWHPDRFGEDDALRRKAEEKLKVINEAYATIRDGGAGPRRSRTAHEDPHGAWRVRSRGREMRFSDLGSIAAFVERGALRESSEVLDPSGNEWIPLMEIPQLRTALVQARMRRNRGWAATCATFGIFVLLRRPTPGGLLIALVLFGASIVLLYRSQQS